MNHLGTKTLETDRLILRRFTLEDADAVWQNWANDDAVTAYLTWPTHPCVDASRGYMQYCVNSYAAPDCYQWGIVLRESGELIGNISVVSINEGAESCDLGWVIGRRWWGQGIMPEAAREVLHFLFEEVGFGRIAAAHDVENPKSGRVMQKIGMQFEGVQRRSSRNNRGIVDTAWYAILRDEYLMEK